MDQGLANELRVLFDPEYYLERYPDVRASGMDPLHHYVDFGANEGRDPNRYFDGAWYRQHHPEVVSSQLDPLLHYLKFGASQLRNPHPRFDAAWYAAQHPEAAGNPLVFHMLFGRPRGWATEPPLNMDDFLFSAEPPPNCPRGLVVDVIIPVFRGLEETRRCLTSVLDDPSRPPGRIIVVDDASPEQGLSAWLEELRNAGRIMLLRNCRNLGFVASANAGIEAAGNHDVVLLNSDTEVPVAWLSRLAGHAYSSSRIGTVSPFSNNATVCGYPSLEGGPAPFDLPVGVIDAACQTANGNRRVYVPTTVGFCMYVRRQVLDQTGLFDEKAFGRGYGEENDLCMRAAALGWRHVLACDTFVYHKGKVSFGADASSSEKRAQDILAERWPDYADAIDAHVRRDPPAPFRMAATLALFQTLDHPVILLVTHGLGGGVQRQINEIVRATAGRASFLQLTSTHRGSEVTPPGLEGHPPAVLPGDRPDDLVTLLRFAGVSRVHVHHLLGSDLDIRALIHRLGVPFDVTIHDYFGVCPQVNLLPWFDSQYCNEPDPAQCNACIADRSSHNARDIISWRRSNAWQFLEADRVICPSNDVKQRLARYGLASRAVVAPHEPVAEGQWQINPPSLAKGQKLRVALIGVLAQQKGLATVSAVAEHPDSATLEIRLVGYPEQELAEPVRRKVKASGAYEEEELPDLLAKTAPHVVWFPAQWPETYSYTLSAAIEAGLPVVASNIGAFTERLAGRPLTWLIDPAAPVRAWLEAFAEARTALLEAREPAKAERSAQPDFYAGSYLLPTRPPRPYGQVDLRRPGRTAVVLIPETFADGTITPCGYIRLLQPLDHLAPGADLDIVVADPEEATRYIADVFVTQRHAVEGAEPAEALLAHCRSTRAALMYDLDDDLLDIPRDHPDAAVLRPMAWTVDRMLRGATSVWVSTQPLAQKLRSIRSDAQVMPNALDERIWKDALGAERFRQGTTRILFMGTATHGADFALVEPALARLHEQFGGRVAFDMIGVTTKTTLPHWVNRLAPTGSAGMSYPGFVNWICQRGSWDVGICPLVASPFTKSKSIIKAMDYAALGLAVVASDVAPYHDTLSGDTGTLLVKNTATAWTEALGRLVRHAQLRKELAANGRRALAQGWTLAAQQDARLEAWKRVLAGRPGERKAAPRSGAKRRGTPKAAAEMLAS